MILEDLKKIDFNETRGSFGKFWQKINKCFVRLMLRNPVAVSTAEQYPKLFRLTVLRQTWQILSNNSTMLFELTRYCSYSLTVIKGVKLCADTIANPFCSNTNY